MAAQPGLSLIEDMLFFFGDYIEKMFKCLDISLTPSTSLLLIDFLFFFQYYSRLYNLYDW